MKKWLLILCLSLVFTACGGANNGSGSGGGGGGGGTATPTPVPDPGDEASTYLGLPGMNNVGDAGKITFNDGGQSRFALLGDKSTAGRDNTNEEFTLILYNSSDTQTLGFAVTSPDDTEAPSTSSSRISAKVTPPNPLSVTDQKFMDLVNSGHAKAGGNLNPYIQASVGDVVGAQKVFRARCDVDDADVFCTTSATLRAQDTNVNVWLDDDVPFEDASITYDTTQAMVDQIAGMFQDNIYPLMTTLFGTPSDVNGDSRISILITPLMNNLPWTDGDKTDFPKHIAGYADPRDLLAYNESTNAGSNEEEVIYIRAYDPEYFWGPAIDYGGSIGGSYVPWTGAVMAAGFEKLISYNQHVFVNSGSAEDDWVSDGLGAVAAMLCGFGNAVMHDVHWFLDVPHAWPLKNTNDFLLLRDPAEYLFMLYLVYTQIDDSVSDTNGDGYDDELSFIANFYGSDTGVTNIENVITYDFTESIETEFDAIFKAWTVALVTSQNIEVSGSSFTYYDPINSLVFGSGINDSSGSTRDDGTGSALGTQVGINFVGRNPNTDGISTYLFENVDELTYTPGHITYGSVPPYGVYFIRLGGLIEPETNIVIDSSALMQGFVVRQNDITYRRVYGEKVFGSLEPRIEDIDTIFSFGSTYNVATDTLPGDEITIVGKIDEPDTIAVYDENFDNKEYKEVPDFDRYHITIPADTADVAIWVEKQADSTSGESTLKPLLAIVSADNNIDPLITDRPTVRFGYAGEVGAITTDYLQEPGVDGSADPWACAGGAAVTSPAPFAGWLDTFSGYPSYTVGALFNLEILNTDPAYPDIDLAEQVYYEPRHTQADTQDCDAPADGAVDFPDNEISYSEITAPSTLTQQMMVHMIRTYTATQSDDTCFAIDTEVRDEESDKNTETYQLVDMYHNIGGNSVPPYATENGLLFPDGSTVDLAETSNSTPTILDISCGGNTNYLALTSGNEYIILVGGANNTKGRYALKLRRLDNIGNPKWVQRQKEDN